MSVRNRIFLALTRFHRQTSEALHLPLFRRSSLQVVLPLVMQVTIVPCERGNHGMRPSAEETVLPVPSWAGEKFLGWRLTLEPESDELLLGLLMIDQLRAGDPEWLEEPGATLGECELVAMTPLGLRAAPRDPT